MHWLLAVSQVIARSEFATGRTRSGWTITAHSYLVSWSEPQPPDLLKRTEIMLQTHQQNWYLVRWPNSGIQSQHEVNRMLNSRKPKRKQRYIRL